MNRWQIRFTGTGTMTQVASPQEVIEGLRAGDWDSTDEVRGPDDTDWRSVEDHPAFADIASEISPPRIDPPDETRLDMNPLIDVALVLLIFFIITTTYASLRRSIDVPAEPEDKKGKVEKKVTAEDLKDVAFSITVWMNGEKPIVKIDDKIVDEKSLERVVREHVRSTGRRELILAVEGKVPWGVEASVHDAAKAAEITRIYRRPYKPPS